MSKKSFTSEFKSKVAIEALKGHQTIAELASEFDIHPTQINNWKKQLLETSKTAFNGKQLLKAQQHQEEERERHKSSQILIRQIKYLNNIDEPDHRFIKKITNPMLGFKSYTSAHATLMGIELHHMLHKGKHKNSKNIPDFEQFYALAA